jgi:quercetin dioxygenase-like cupin family protein
MSQVENGAVSPSLSSLEKIAQALETTVRDFFASPGDDQALVVRRAERRHMASGWSRARLEALGIAGQKLMAMMVTLEAGGQSAKRPVAQPREEFAFVTEGNALLTLGDESFKLAKGDSVVIPAGVERLWVNEGRKLCLILLVSAL